MLLKKFRRRLAGATNLSDDGGVVMIAVISVSVVVMIICAVISTSAVRAITFSSTTRAALQSRAAADAGIDVVRSAMVSSTFYCQLDTTLPSGLEFSVHVDYFDEDDNPLICAGVSSLSGTPAKGVVYSTGFAESAAIGQATGGENRTVISVLDIVVTDNQVNLDKVFFSDAGYTITNSTNIIDGAGQGHANLYSNETVYCKTAISLQGSVYTQGDFIAQNTCKITGSVWAGGAVTSADQMSVVGDVMSAGGTGATPTGVSLDKAWVGGSVVANGSVSANNTSNTAYCSLAGYNAKVCGNVISLEGTITLSNSANIAGSAYAYKTVDIGTTNSNLIIGGNVVSTTGSLLAKNTGNSGYRVGGYVAIKGSSQVPKARIGNQASSCASATTGLVACSPTSPAIPLSGIPAVLNFPTETRVIAPPRESLPRVKSDTLSMGLWTADGWVVENVTCANLVTRINAGWTGKLLLNVSGCSAPLDWDNKTFTLTGDLVIMNPSGLDAKNDLTFKSNNSTVRTLQFIVPSDAKLSNGITNLVTWSAPSPSYPDYTKPTCVAGKYGDFLSSKISTTKIEMFIYTPCSFEVANQMINFKGQIYSGTSVYPNNSSITYVPIDVPGATTATATVAPGVVVTETSRFDARG